MTFNDGIWNLSRDSPDLTRLDFRQHFLGEFNSDGGTGSVQWETSSNGSSWEHDFDLSYRQVE